MNTTIDEKVLCPATPQTQFITENNTPAEPAVLFKVDTEKELKKIDLGKCIILRLLERNGEKFLNFAKYYKGYPTKKVIEIPYNTYLAVKNILN